MNKNEEKAKELSQKYFPDYENIFARGNVEQQRNTFACLEMAEWKDEQFAAEKQALIDKVCEVLKIRLLGDCMSEKSFDYFIVKFKKVMEETK